MARPSATVHGTFARGAAWLVRHPAATLPTLAAGTLLSAVVPLLQRWTGRSDDAAALLFALVGMLPWELYILPRFLARLDAEELGHPANPADAWKLRFEERWLPTLLAKLALNLAVGVGLLAFLVPGLLVLLAFGWAPYRVLLRGERLRDAMRGSLQLMRRQGPRAVLLVTAAFLVGLGTLAALVFLASLVHPGPGPMPLGSPFRWLLEACTVVVSLWLSATLLAVYQWLESEAEPASGK